MISVRNWYWEGPTSFWNKTQRLKESKKVTNENPRATSMYKVLRPLLARTPSKDGCAVDTCGVCPDPRKKRLITPKKGVTIQSNKRVDPIK